MLLLRKLFKIKIKHNPTQLTGIKKRQKEYLKLDRKKYEEYKECNHDNKEILKKIKIF